MVLSLVAVMILLALFIRGGNASPPGERKYPIVQIALQENNSACSFVVAIYEIYNSTETIINFIDESSYNFTLWNGGLATLKHAAEKKDTKEIKSRPMLDTAHPPEVLGVGVPLEIELAFATNLTQIGAQIKDMDKRLCVHSLNKTTSKPANTRHRKSTTSTTTSTTPRTTTTTKKPVEFPNSIVIDSHLTSVVIPNIFHHILIVAQESKNKSGSKPFTASPFTYYINQTTDGRLHVEYGSIPTGNTSYWAWHPACNCSNCDAYHLVSKSNPNNSVGLGPDGDLQLCPDNNTSKLNFTITFNRTRGHFNIYSTKDNETFCIVQFFASTLRLIPIEAMKSVDREICTGFHLQVGKITGYSAEYNTTYVDLYSTKSEKTVDEVLGPSGDTHTEITSTNTAILYFISDPSELGLFLRWESPVTPLQELYIIADHFFEPGTTCSDNYDHVHPILTCVLTAEGRKTNSSIVSHAGEHGQRRMIPVTDSKVKLFRHYTKFKFVSEGLQTCGDNETVGRCTKTISIPRESVEDMLDEKEVSFSKIVEGDNGVLLYWTEGIITAANTTMITVTNGDTSSDISTTAAYE